MVWEPTAADLIADAVQRKLADIDRHAAMLQDRHLSHGSHLYYADPGSLATITTTLAIAQMLADTDPEQSLVYGRFAALPQGLHDLPTLSVVQISIEEAV